MSVFTNVAGLRPRRSVFNLSHEVKMTADFGLLYPFFFDEMIPGDKFKIGNEIVARLQPMVYPILDDITIKTEYFFVPYRLLWPSDYTGATGWEGFITGGPDGTAAPTIPQLTDGIILNPDFTDKGSLWDYFGFPVGIVPDNVIDRPNVFPWRAYRAIWTNYYRDETLDVPLDPTVVSSTHRPLSRRFRKDYFTSALPWQQRGTAPALSGSGSSTSAVWSNSTTSSVDNPISLSVVPTSLGPNVIIGGRSISGTAPGLQAANDFKALLNSNVVDLTNTTFSFDTADMRLMFQTQKWLERSARGGYRYKEELGTHWGQHLRDERLQRPEFIGGSRSPVIISEVLQTSEDGSTPQGTLAGHGITADKNYVASYHAVEYGIVMGLLSIMPKQSYSQGINRKWTRQTKWDYPWPEFVNLSEQPILEKEIFAVPGTTSNNTVFGYTGRYNELRFSESRICGGMRDDYFNHHLSRKFAARPLLNSNFLDVSGYNTADGFHRAFAVTNQDPFELNIANIVTAIRPIPVESNPGLIDHN